jgi:hypothetical protein
MVMGSQLLLFLGLADPVVPILLFEVLEWHPCRQEFESVPFILIACCYQEIRCRLSPPGLRSPEVYLASVSKTRNNA